MPGAICQELYARSYMLGAICQELYARSYILGAICPVAKPCFQHFSRLRKPHGHGQQDELRVRAGDDQGQADDEVQEDDLSSHLKVGKFFRGRAEQGQAGLHEVERSEAASRVLLVREGLDRHRDWTHHGKACF